MQMDMNKYQGVLKGKRKLVGWVIFCITLMAMYLTGETGTVELGALVSGFLTFVTGNTVENAKSGAEAAAKLGKK